MQSPRETSVNMSRATTYAAATSLKCAGSLIAKQAERTKLITIVLPRAYAELGKVCLSEAGCRDDLKELTQRINTLSAERAKIKAVVSSRAKGTTIAGKTKQAVADATALARTKATDLKIYQALARLGQAVYEKYGSNSGPVELTEPIAKAIAQREQLDQEIAKLTDDARGSWLTPKRIAWGGGSLIVCLLIGSGIAGRGAGKSGATPVPSSVGESNPSDVYAPASKSGPASGETRPDSIASQTANGSNELLRALAKMAFKEPLAGASPEEVQAVLRAKAAANQAEWGAFSHIVPTRTMGEAGDHNSPDGFPVLVHWYGKDKFIECHFIKDELKAGWGLVAAFVGEGDLPVQAKRGFKAYVIGVAFDNRLFQTVVHAPITGDHARDAFGGVALELLSAQIGKPYSVKMKKLIH